MERLLFVFNFVNLLLSMEIIRINGIGDGRVSDYARLTEAQLRNKLNPANAKIIVESPKVILSALSSGLIPISILCEEKHIKGDAKEAIAMADESLINAGKSGVPVYTAERKELAVLTGYTLTRGVLCAMERPMDKTLENLTEIFAGSSAEGESCQRRIAVLSGVCDSTNIGAIFRSAAALGMDAVCVTRDCCDPLCRRSIRVSMGSVFRIPWVWIDNPEELKEHGFNTIAMALSDDSIALEDERLRKEKRLAIIVGSEGYGLESKDIGMADFVVKIPMYYGVDSLNVAAAAAISFWELRKR